VIFHAAAMRFPLPQMPMSRKVGIKASSWKENHHQAESVEADGKIQLPLGKDGKRAFVLEGVSSRVIEKEERQQSEKKIEDRRGERSLARWRSHHDEKGSSNRSEDEKV